LKKEKNVGAKVGNLKKFPVEILKTKKSSGKIRKRPKKFPGKPPWQCTYRMCRTGAMYAGTVLRYQNRPVTHSPRNNFPDLPPDLCGRVAKPTKSKISSDTAPDPFFFSALYPPGSDIGMSKGARDRVTIPAYANE
jgi:hypothetical protein